MSPSMTIIIPTHNRQVQLLQTLNSLANQTSNPESFEVIVVADGCKDSTSVKVRKLSTPYRLTLIEQPPSGAASARNRGANFASTHILIFLDDDIDPKPDLVRSHLEAHEKWPEGVILGNFPIAEEEGRRSLFESGNRVWWSKYFAEIGRDAYRFTLFDLCAGNFSINCDLFKDIGGFDENFLVCEDTELGFRLHKRGIKFHFARNALAYHHANVNQQRLLRRRVEEGKAHVLLVKKHKTAEIAAALPLGYAIDIKQKWQKSKYKSDLPENFLQLIWSNPILAKYLISCLQFPLYVSRKFRIYPLYYKILGLTYNYYYWCGVRDEIGSLSSLQNLIHDSQAEPKNFKEVEIDLEK
ncbi:MAG: glycosyltransferase, partial [Methanotrichaceae archaeon]|nr:glycosyltransferase [Methanotrichaceae archaeon]